MDKREKRTQRDYTLAFKLAVVDEVEKGELTYKQAQKRYGIQGRSTVLVWLRKHGRQDWGSLSMLGRRRSDPVSKQTMPQTPEQRIKELETQLKEANQKAQLFEAMLEVIRTEYGVTAKKAFRRVIEQKKVAGLSLARACKFFGCSRQAYYQQVKSETDLHERDEKVVELVREVRRRQPRIGVRKLHHMLRRRLAAKDIKLGRDGMFATLKRAHLLVPKARAYHKTTDSFYRFYKHPNLLKPGMDTADVHRPEQVWVADITYVPTRERCVYLSLVTDAYSRKIVGYYVHASLQTEEVAEAFKMALHSRRSCLPLIHHSDRGIQYCAGTYQALHAKHGTTCSMTDGYDCYQNALAERINGILKTEFLLHRPHDLAEAKRMVAQSVAIYNRERPHQALKYKTPDEIHRAL
ncbi:IS3 family transposase [Massilia sp. LjRoot122]